MCKILVTGACGYKGSVLVPKLLNSGYQVVALDTQWFGNFLPSHSNLTVVCRDVRMVSEVDLRGVDKIIHLASVANDPCGALDTNLTWEVGALGSMHLIDLAVRTGVKQFIYASSGSVYGVKSEAQVVETLPLNPLSVYNKSKMVAERCLMSYADQIAVQIVRPATVCGLSPRMRLDVSVNMLTLQALKNGVITVFGGSQIRPHVHMEDITDLYIRFLEHPNLTGIYNAGFENKSIMDVAQAIVQRIPADIQVTSSNDPRSYRINSDKLLATGFSPRWSVKDAVNQLISAWENNELEDRAEWYNLAWMQKNLDQVKEI